MKKNVIITIAREFGAEGHEIGKKLSERLGINLYDKDILAKAAKDSGMSAEGLRSIDEKLTGKFLHPYLALGMGAQEDSDILFKAEERVIHELSEKESCIIVGRLADYILKDDPNCIKVFIFAPLEERVRIIHHKYDISKEEAKKLVRKMDAARANYYSYYSYGKWSQKKGKDITLNRGAFGVDGCVDILEAMARSRGNF